jgi:hypothetical protein
MKPDPWSRAQVVPVELGKLERLDWMDRTIRQPGQQSQQSLATGHWQSVRVTLSCSSHSSAVLRGFELSLVY